MDPQIQINELIKKNHGVLIREGKHLVYRFPNGLTYTVAKSPSDSRAANNQLSQLKNLLNVGSRSKQKDVVAEGAARHEGDVAEAELKAHPPRAVSTEKRLTTIHVEKEKTIVEILQELVAQTQEEFDGAMFLATELEQRLKFYKDLLTQTFDIEPALSALMSPLLKIPEPIPTHPVPPPPPPQHITSYVKVTRELVLAATKTFDEPFKLGEIVDRMINGAQVSDSERLRIRNSVYGALRSLADRGEAKLVVPGKGRRPALFGKA